MSSFAPAGPDKTENKQGFNKLVKRVKTVLKRGSSNGGSISSAADISVEESIKAPALTESGAASESANPMASGSVKTSAAVAEPIVVDPDYMKPENTPKPTISSVHAAIQQSIRDMNPSSTRAVGASRNVSQQEKARALFEKYGMKFEASEWQYPGVPAGERIERPIRMRVHRTCHRCQTMFGHEKSCSNCGHARCKSCPRYPVKKSKQAKAKGAGTGAASVMNMKKAVAESGPTQEDKARALFEKYGLKLESHEWQSPVTRPSERVEKPIRMRIHRHCHRCQTTFGPDKTCSNCSHTRCKKCPRYPAKKKKMDALAQAKATAAGDDPVGGVAAKTADAETTKTKTKSKYPPLTMPGKNGKDLVRRRPRQIVRRTCHLCETLFVRSEKTCSSCQHIRCKICPRDPAKLHKYPDGYPGDAEPPPELYPPMERQYRKTRMRVKWTCHSCSALFKEHSKTCEKCNHERCDDCTRSPPKKVRSAPDPSVLESLEQKIGKLYISSA